MARALARLLAIARARPPIFSEKLKID